MDSGWAKFRANFTFEPRDEREIKIREGDILLVAKPVQDPGGWLTGENTNTGEVGEFPGTYVDYIEDVEDLEAPPKPPPRPPKTRYSTDVSGGHSLTEKAALKPVWCCKCEDFIWGAGSQFVRCTVCDLAWHHPQCEVDLATFPCVVNHKTDQDEEEEDNYIHLVTSPKEWDVTDVLIWLAATNSFLYAEAFRENEADGEKLLKISEGLLPFENLGVRDGTHKQTILLAIQELFFGQSETRTSEMFTGLQSAKRGTKGSHIFKEETFTSLQWCDKCGKCLWGLHTQGVQCTECGYHCHRKCMFDAVVVCPRRRVRRRRESDADVPVFGQELGSQFRPSNKPAPTVVMKCVQAIEKRGLQEINVHRIVPAGSEKNSLRTALNQSAKNVNMEEEEWRGPHCVSSVLKMYLIELPTCIFTTEHYFSFVKTFKAASRDSVGARIMELVENLPGANKSVLNYLLEHLYKVSKKMEWNDMSSTRLASVFAPILLRPDRSHVSAMVTNHGTTVEIIDFLITNGEWTREVAPPVVPRRPRKQRLEDCSWYWGDINRETVSERLKDQQDGTFIVRDARRVQGEYTLTLRKGGLNKQIRILCQDGKYGFSMPLTFSSLVELINYYRERSLASYNSNLDVKLSYPLQKFEQDDDEVGQETDEVVLYLEKLKEAQSEFQTKSNDYETIHQEFTQSELVIAECREELEAQGEIVKLTEEQIRLHETFRDEAPPQDRAILGQNYEILLHRLQEAKGVLIGIQRELADACEETRRLDKLMNNSRPVILDLQKRQQKYYLVLFTKYKLGVDEIKERMEMDLSEPLWKYGKLTREEAEDLLKGQPDGTFIIRESARRPGEYALGLVYNETVKHIIISRGENGFYGLAKNFTTHPTLLDMVQYYNIHSLECHNDALKTTLMFPLRRFEGQQ